MSFPSPYGVSFILMQLALDSKHDGAGVFPSPYGVSFILILWSKNSFVAIFF